MNRLNLQFLESKQANIRKKKPRKYARFVVIDPELKMEIKNKLFPDIDISKTEIGNDGNGLSVDIYYEEFASMNRCAYMHTILIELRYNESISKERHRDEAGSGYPYYYNNYIQPPVHNKFVRRYFKDEDMKEYVQDFKDALYTYFFESSVCLSSNDNDVQF